MIDDKSKVTLGTAGKVVGALLIAITAHGLLMTRTAVLESTVAAQQNALISQNNLILAHESRIKAQETLNQVIKIEELPARVAKLEAEQDRERDKPRR